MIILIYLIICFVSSCTVLSMSCYSVGKSILAHEKKVKIFIGLPLTASAAIGGIIGKQIFTILKSISGNQYGVGLIQATCLGIVTLGTIIYILNRHQIKTHETKSPVLCILIGFTLGILSSFLGIGGGPINLMVLYYFFSMDAKTAAELQEES